MVSEPKILIIPQKKNLQTQLDKHNEAFREMMAEMQQSFRDTLDATVWAIHQANQPTPVLQQHEARDFEDDDDEDVLGNNPFAHLGEQLYRGDQRPHDDRQ